MRHHTVSARPGGQPCVLGATGQHQHRRALEHFVFQRPAHAHATSRGGFPVENCQINATLRHATHYHWLSRDFDVLNTRKFGGGTTSERRDHLRAAVGVAAVQEDRERSSR